MEDPRSKQQREESSAHRGKMSGMPAHMQAAAESAGESSPIAGAQSIGISVGTTGAQALHGTGETQPSNQARWKPVRMAFDTHEPPSPALIDDCVHCGFCLPTCPTYLLWGEEMDSPRGRIHLMKLASEGRAAMTDTFVRHFDQCLGCMACMTACPSGVQYDKLIEATRGQIERRHPRPASDRLLRGLIFGLFPHPVRLRLIAPALLLYRRSGLMRLVEKSGILSRLPTQLASLHNVMPSVRWSSLRARTAPFTPARGERRARVGMLTGCVQSVFFEPVNAATVRVLSSEGCDVVAPVKQGCCGALALHSGREEEAKSYARKLIQTFESTSLDYIAVNAAGCGSSMKEYGHLLRNDPLFASRAERFSSRVRDISELLAELGPVAPRKTLKGTVAYHDACHLAHAQGVRRQPRQLLEGIPGLTLVPVAESEICCGSAGIYNLVEPQPAEELGERKVKNIYDSGAQVVASGNPGCTLQISATARRLGRPLKVMHPIEILDRSLHGPLPG